MPHRRALALLTSVGLLVGCSTSSNNPQPVIATSATPTSTATPASTATQAPTATPTATAAPSPTPKPTGTPIATAPPTASPTPIPTATAASFGLTANPATLAFASVGTFAAQTVALAQSGFAGPFVTSGCLGIASTMASGSVLTVTPINVGACSIVVTGANTAFATIPVTVTTLTVTGG